MTEPVPDPEIPPDETAYRRVPNVHSADFIVVDEGTKERRPSSGAFKPDSDGLSVYLRSLLGRAGLDASALLKNPEINGVAGLTVAAVRKAGLGVANDAWPLTTDDPEHPRNGAHALVVGFHGLSNGQRRKRQQKLALHASLIIDPGAR